MNPSPEELIFAAASSFDDAMERKSFLDLSCRGEPELRQRIEEMFELQDEAAAFFEFQPALDAVSAGEQSGKAGDEGVGAQIGRYRLIARIGTGGCGVVYYAEQEEPVRRKVALKIVKLGMDTETVIARFEMERQSLAQMDHPNIARVLDAGATASGRPYFAMELVEGEGITQFCDAHHLGIRERLELFVQVCGAIQHAHQKGVIHRDIKPSNVLVRLRDGVVEPKVIDFGIAKATDNRVGESSPQGDPFFGTPAYMSPEQVLGVPEADTRSDIYSLGVVLYELLSGRLPHDAQEQTQIFIGQTPRPLGDSAPSTAFKRGMPEERAKIAKNRSVDPSRLPLLLKEDLDWIVMKAMEKEPARRYDTAAGLAMDLQCSLNLLPVTARPPTATYLMGKFVRRHKLRFAAGSVAVFGLLAGFSISTMMFFRERAARYEQARLRENAEFRGLVAQAAVRVKYGDLSGADTLLKQVPIEQTPSSLEAAEAFRAVADWHIHSERLQEAGPRYSSMIRALSSVDTADLPQISFNLLPAAAAVAFTEGSQRYEEVRQMAIKRFGGTTNPVVARQIIKACLLLPADQATLDALGPPAAIVEKSFLSSADRSAWACFSLSLMFYRRGEYEDARKWADLCLKDPNKIEMLNASMLIVRAMVEQQSGQVEEARISLAKGKAIQERLASDRQATETGGAFSWFDWVNAAILLEEAQRLIQ